jgi:hypothetical protein
MYGSPPWLCDLSSANRIGEATLMSSVGVKLGSIFRSSGLPMSDEGVSTAGTGRVGSSPAGYDRGSARLILEREEDDEAIEGAMSLLPVAVEKVEAIERRDRHDDPEEDVVLELEVVVDMKDEATELRPGACEWVNSENQKTRPTRLESLRKHALDEMWRVSCQQSVDVSHRLVGDVEVVLHDGEVWPYA